jgi:hypothetical protein
MVNIKEYGMVKKCALLVAGLFSIIFVACDNGSTTHTHEWGNWLITTPATCIVEGIETRTCNSCNEQETQVVALDLNNHISWGVWSTTITPTQTTDGEQERACTNCEKKQPVSHMPLAIFLMVILS